MIGYLRGRLVWKQPPRLLIDVNGTGYDVEVPVSTFAALPALGESLELRTHLAIRDRQHQAHRRAADAVRR